MAKRGVPVIGVTTDTNQGRESDLHEFKGHTVFWLKKNYTDAVEKSGGLPVLIPVVSSPRKVAAYLDMLDGLIISGGHFDIAPSIYGERRHPKTGPIKADRTKMEMGLFRAAYRRGMPILGICGGLQAINVALGGTLYQHIPDQVENALDHENAAPAKKPSHFVDVVGGSLLAKAVSRKRIKVNSTHHQGIQKTGSGLSACAVAPDGVVEAVEMKKSGGPFILGVQWHPEALFKRDEASRRIFKLFISECRKFKSGR